MIETLNVEKLSASVKRRPPDGPEELMPRNRYVRGAALWLGINLFQAISKASGLSNARKEILGEWHLAISILASIGFLFLVFVSLRQLERLAEHLGNTAGEHKNKVLWVFVAMLIAACAAAPAVWWVLDSTGSKTC